MSTAYGFGMRHEGNGREILNGFQASGERSPQLLLGEDFGRLPSMDDARHKQQVGERLRVAREALGLDQRKMAEIYGLDHTKLSHWERGKHYPAPAFIARLWERHRIPADWIYLGEVAGVRHDLAESLLAGVRAGAAGDRAAGPTTDETGAAA